MFFSFSREKRTVLTGKTTTERGREEKKQNLEQAFAWSKLFLAPNNLSLQLVTTYDK
jgi:hypothetical protein